MLRLLRWSGSSLCLLFCLGFPSCLNAQEADIYVARATVAYQRQQYPEALDAADEALALDPDNVKALYYKGLTLIVLKRPAEAQTALERAREHEPGHIDIAFQLAALYFAEKQYNKAEPLFQEVYEVEPARKNLGFYLGFIEYRKKNYRSALSFLEGAVPADEQFAQLIDLYSALAKAALGSPREAGADLAKALAIEPASALTARGQRFGELLQAKADEEKFFSGELRFGVFYDTNVPVIPLASGDIVVQRLRANQSQTESPGQVISTNLSYAWLRNLDWEGTISHRFFQTFNNSLPEFNLQSNTPSFSLVRRGAIPTDRFGDLPYNTGFLSAYEYMSLGNTRFIQSWIFNPFFTLVENPSNQTFLQYRFRYREFFQDDTVIGAERRTGPNYMVGGIHYWSFANGLHFINLGYQFDYDDVEGNNWQYSGNRLLAGFQYTLPWQGIRFRYQMDFQWRNYRNENTLLDLQSGTGKPTTRRDDLNLAFFASLAYDFRLGSMESKDFTLSLDYLYVDNRSNLDVYAYHRHIVTTSLTWRF